jgi:glycosyltransferase involved in cell wall biosynthesis
VVLMEAMACNRAVVATAISGVRELVADGETGMLVTPGRADELAAAIDRLLRDPQLRSDLASAGRARVRREFDIDRSAGQLAELFNEIEERIDRPLQAALGAEAQETALGAEAPALEAVASF